MSTTEELIVLAQAGDRNASERLIEENTGLIWSLAELVNGLMAIPNLITLVILSADVQSLTCQYQSNDGG